MTFSTAHSEHFDLVPLGFYPEDMEIVRKDGSLTRPVERAPGMPFGISFFGTAYTESDLVGFAFAYEQITRARLGRRAYAAAIPKTQLSDIVGKATE